MIKIITNPGKIIRYSLVALCATFLFLGGPDQYTARSVLHLWDLGHILLFALFIYIILNDSGWFKEKSFIIQLTWVILITFFLGVVSELAQNNFNRRPEIGDMRRDIEGGLLALFFFSATSSRLPNLLLRSLQVVILIAVIFEAAPVGKAIMDEATARRSFPVLADFETPFEINRWRGRANISINNEIAYNGKASMKVRLTTAKYSGVFMRYFPRDWKGYAYLHAAIYNESRQPLEITVRINDELHINRYNDRFNRVYLLRTGWNKISIPLERVKNAPKKRKMDLRRIRSFGFFVISQPVPKTIYIDNVRLAMEQ